MNNVSLMGRLTRDAELRYASNTEMAILRFNVAVDRRLSKEKKAQDYGFNQAIPTSNNELPF